ncbi:hypothetical protein D8674_041362 [Pyrus ussuriensis x Pyrus communis]|uniref:Uncharacterized protein n=1 Tax=Pyrus ussuriensis x Pyrus communis TaxID=2448454 RepID=A0A5N5I464_9ROSA|nr:hypothetical protein D8674_041362 [Pyrus ussuriensis x Pyrus communis]
MDQRKIVACYIVNVWYLNIMTWLMMWFIKNYNSARRQNRQLALRNRTFVRKMRATNDNDLAMAFKEMLSESVDKLGEVLQVAFGKGVDPKPEIVSELSKMDLSIEDQIKALNILFEKPQNERTFSYLDGAMKKAFVLMLLGQSNPN